MSIKSWLFGEPVSETKTQMETKSVVETSVHIIDPRRISVVKSHSIVGALECSNYLMSKYLRLIKWLKTNELALADTTLADGDTLPSYDLALYPAIKGGAFAIGPGCFSTAKPDDPVYVLGDTHGDFESFIAILETIIDRSSLNGISNPIVYLLGDIIDRNGEGCMLETAMILAILQKALPPEFEKFNSIRLGIVKGDHDVALKWDIKANKFVSEVSPADYCDWLNARAAKDPTGNSSKIGRAWIRLMEECPSGAFLEGSGTFLSHGGIPRSDLQEKVTTGIPYVFQSKQFAQDCEWCRMVDAKNKLLNRSSKTSEIGFQEFDAFNRNIMAGRIRKFVFGHQHPVKGFQRYDKNYTGYDIICISSFRDDTAMGFPVIPHFCQIEKDAINVYSMNPAIYVVRLEENSVEHKKVMVTGGSNIETSSKI